MSAWMIVVNYMLPIAFFILLILSIPFPNFIGKYRNKFLKTLGEVKIPYTDFNILLVSSFIAILLFIISAFDVWKYSKDNKIVDSEGNIYIGTGLNPKRAVRWRAERNFWISACNLIMYWSIYVIYNIQNKLFTVYNEKHSLEEKLLNFKNQDESTVTCQVTALEINNNNVLPSTSKSDLEGFITMDGIRQRCINDKKND